MTLPEKLLWKELRRLKLHIRRQAPIGRYVVDFVNHRAALVVEVDSARHDLPEDQLHDLTRTEWLNSQGYRVLRFRNDEVLADAPGVAERILVELSHSKALPLGGEGLGEGAASADEGNSRETSPALPFSSLAASPASPTLPPSRGGEEAPPFRATHPRKGG
jgi:very-short-patch-repair endonuclease